jgi:hypothetical protein
MALALGKRSEADRWTGYAEAIRALIVKRIYDLDDAAFYDRDAEGNFVRIRGDVISRVLGERVADPRMFDTIWERQIHVAKAFWARYPLPSIALDDPAFVKPIPRNSWGGAAQALTALRAPRWMEHYGKPAELAWMMQRWIEAIRRRSEFRQQIDPGTGDFTDSIPGATHPPPWCFWIISGGSPAHARKAVAWSGTCALRRQGNPCSA